MEPQNINTTFSVFSFIDIIACLVNFSHPYFAWLKLSFFLTVRILFRRNTPYSAHGVRSPSWKSLGVNWNFILGSFERASYMLSNDAGDLRPLSTENESPFARFGYGS